nr:HD domain-containing protein [Lachnospiraceae bacterium]
HVNIYICSIIITDLLMIAMTIHVLSYIGFNKKQKIWFSHTFLSIIFCSLAELCVHCGYYKPVYAFSLTIITVLQFSVSPMLAVMFTGALGLHKQSRIASLYFILCLTIEAACAPYGLVFYFNENGYNRGEYFIIYEIMYIISMLYLAISLIIVGKKFNHRDTLTILMVVIVLIGGILPMSLFKINITYVAIGVSACLCYIYYNDLVQQDIKSELVENQEKMNEMQIHIISGLSNLIENRDAETGEHVFRTGQYVKAIAENAVKEGIYTDILDEHYIELLCSLAPLHDVGKIVVSDQILKKPGKLTSEEFEEIKKHTSVGGNVVKQILEGITDEEYINFAADIATYHHEKWNGSGYPNQLSGDDIPLSARIMAIADVFDALVSERCYKKPFTFEEAIKIIEDGAGTHFDPKLVEVFLKYKDEFR